MPPCSTPRSSCDPSALQLVAPGLPASAHASLTTSMAPPCVRMPRGACCARLAQTSSLAHLVSGAALCRLQLRSRQSSCCQECILAARPDMVLTAVPLLQSLCMQARILLAPGVLTLHKTRAASCIEPPIPFVAPAAAARRTRRQQKRALETGWSASCGGAEHVRGARFL